MLKNIVDEPAMPVYWGKNQPGMQANEELSGINMFLAKSIWKLAAYNASFYTYLLNKLGVHKQIGNRIVEPWMYTKTILTSTNFSNFFNLRCHSDAQPEIKELATKMRMAYNHSTPTLINYNEWHLPYVTDGEKNNNSTLDCIKMSVARCARVSYANHDGTSPILYKDIQLHDKLLSSDPKHMSPAEHQGLASGNTYYANFKGWKQYRWFIEHPEDKIYV